MIKTWKSGTKPGGGGGGPSVFNVLYTYGTDANDQMRLNDTGNEGCSIMASAINSYTDGAGNTFVITEMADTAFDPATDLVGVDVWMTGSFNRIMTTQERDDAMSWLNGGGAIIAYSDNGIDGGGNDAADSRDSMGFDAILSIQFGQDQFDGVRTYVLPASSVLGDALTVEAEGTSPWVIESPYGGPGSLTVLNQHHDQTPGNTNGTSFSGTWGAIGYGTYGSGRFVLWHDRQMTWNNGAGSDILEQDNQQFVLNSIAWAATGVSQA